MTGRGTAGRSTVPSLREERRLLRGGHVLVAGMDEVGRGALAGPVSVGVVVVDLATPTAPSGVRDSKLLAPAAREALVPRLRRWALAHAVGHAEPEEIDRHGIVAALRLAGRRALAQLPQVPGCVLLDGSHDWLSAPRPPAQRRGARGPQQEESLFDDLRDATPCGATPAGATPGGATLLLPDTAAAAVASASGADPGADPAVVGFPREPAPPVPLPHDPVVLTMVKADLRCAAVAAASVLAKVERDAIMVERAAADPRYGWHENKGYSAPEHAQALHEHGPCDQHRRSWSLPGRRLVAAGHVPGV